MHQNALAAAPDPAEGTNSAPPNLLAGFERDASRWRREKEKRWKNWGEKKGNDYTDERPRMRCTLYGRTSVYCTNIIRTNRPYNIGTIYGTNVLKILLYVQNSVVYDNCAHACRDFYSKQTQTAYLCPATWMTTPNSVLYTAKMLWLSAFVRIILVPEQSLPTHCWVQMKHTSLHS